jgi:hypothetical protein
MALAGWFDASSFHPPPFNAAPSWVILNKKARLANCDNATTAYAITSAGRTIKATICLASPPSVSHVSVHYAGSVRAEVSSSAKDLVLLRINSWMDRVDEYFVYHAAASKPSLRAIPCLPIPQETPCFSSKFTPRFVALLPFDDAGGGEFLLAYLTMVDGKVAYDLHVFSSKTWAWSIRALTPPAGVRYHMPRAFDKVIALGGSVLGWVDLYVRGGIIACDILDEDPASNRFIPLPMSDFYKSMEHCRLPAHRDVACYTDGFIVLVDLDLRFRYVVLDSNDGKQPLIKAIKDLDHLDAILDSELACDNEDVDVVRVPDGWKIRTCYRHITWDYWRKGHVVDVDDIIDYDPKHYTMLSELWDGGAGRRTLRKLEAKRLTLSMHYVTYQHCRHFPGGTLQFVPLILVLYRHFD